MALDWCMHCRRPLAREESDYCSPACLRASQASTSSLTLDAVPVDFDTEARPTATAARRASRAPSPTQWPQAGIDAWRAGVPVSNATAHPFTADHARPASPSGSLTSSTRTFSRPELLRRHTCNAPAPASLAVCRARHAATPASPPAPMPGRPALPAWATPATSTTASYITESLIATPASPARTHALGGLLHRVKSWVRAEGGCAPAAAAGAVAPAFVALPGMDSTSTLVGEVAAVVEKKIAALVDDDDLDAGARRAWPSRSPPGLRRAEFRAPRSSRLALDEHPAYNSRGRARAAPSRPPLYSPFGHAL